VDSGHVFAHRTPYRATITTGLRAALDRAGLRAAGSTICAMPRATFSLAQGMTLENVKKLWATDPSP
jgi:hypothetical protein